MKIIIILVISLVSSSLSAENNNSIFQDVYNFNPHELTRSEQESLSRTLDTLWKKVKEKPEKYIDTLRYELNQNNLPPYFYYDGSQLLLTISQTKSDKELIISALNKVDIRDIQHTDYLKTVHRFSVDGFDTVDLAIKILKHDNFKIFIPLHSLTLEQDFSLIYMLMPMHESKYLNKLVDQLDLKHSERAIKSLMLTIWYTSTNEGNEALENYIKAHKNNDILNNYARELLKRNKNVGPSSSLSSVKSLREERRKVMSRISDEALYELNSLTRKLIAKTR